MKDYKLPHGIVVRVMPVSGTGKMSASLISSDLKNGNPDRIYEAAMDAVESVLLAHAAAGVAIDDPAYVEGLNTALEALANNLDEE